MKAERGVRQGKSWTDRLDRMTCSDLLTVLSYSILNVIACALVVHRSCCCRCSMSSRTSHTVTQCSRSWLRGAGWRRERSWLRSPTAGLTEKTSANVLYPLQWRRCVRACVCLCVHVCDMRVCLCIRACVVSPLYRSPYLCVHITLCGRKSLSFTLHVMRVYEPKHPD